MEAEKNMFKIKTNVFFKSKKNTRRATIKVKKKFVEDYVQQNENASNQKNLSSSFYF